MFYFLRYLVEWVGEVVVEGFLLVLGLWDVGMVGDEKECG